MRGILYSRNPMTLSVFEVILLLQAFSKWNLCKLITRWEVTQRVARVARLYRSFFYSVLVHSDTQKHFEALLSRAAVIYSCQSRIIVFCIETCNFWLLQFIMCIVQLLQWLSASCQPSVDML